MAVLTYKCPNCDGPLKWDGGKGKFVCEYCGSAFTEEELKKLAPAQTKEETVDAAEAAAYGSPQNGASAQDFNQIDPAALSGPTASADAAYGAAGLGAAAAGKQDSGSAGAKQPAKIKRYTCPSCGAQIVTDDTTGATTCYYCHNPVVLTDKFDGEFNPDFIIPFAIDKKKATEIFTGWVKQHKYIPRDFYSAKQIELLSGVYFPYWVYHGQIHGMIQGEGEKITKQWDTGNTRNTETAVYRIDQEGDMEINNLTRIALGKASKVLCESVMPFELDKMKPFSTGYLSGYIAESRDIEKSTIEPDIRKEVDEFTMQQLKAKAESGLNNITVSNAATRVISEKFLYALMPVWTLTYKARDGKMYYFSINGQTGKTCGELPTDQRSLLFLFLKIFIPMFIALLAFFRFVV